MSIQKITSIFFFLILHDDKTQKLKQFVSLIQKCTLEKKEDENKTWHDAIVIWTFGEYKGRGKNDHLSRNTRFKCECQRRQTILNKKYSWGNVDVWCMIFFLKRGFSLIIYIKRCLWCQQFNCPLETHCFSHLNTFPNW